MDESRLVGGAVYVIGTDAYLDGASPTPAMVDALAEDIRAAGHHVRPQGYSVARFTVEAVKGTERKDLDAILSRNLGRYGAVFPRGPNLLAGAQWITKEDSGHGRTTYRIGHNSRLRDVTMMAFPGGWALFHGVFPLASGAGPMPSVRDVWHLLGVDE